MKRMHRRLAAFVGAMALGLLVGVALGSYLTHRGGADSPPLTLPDGGSAPEPVSDSPGARVSVLQRSAVDVGERGRSGLELHVVAAETGAALEGVSVYDITAATDTIHYDSLPVLADSDSAGVVRLVTDKEQFIALRKSGRIPAVVCVEEALRSPAPVSVMLRVAHSLRISVVDEGGAPIAGARVEVAPHAYGACEGLDQSGDGSPLSGFPLWARYSDASGSALVTDMPPGRFYVDSWHPEYVPYSPAQWHRIVDMRQDASVSITMKDLYGVVFACPVQQPILHTYWRVDSSKLEIVGGHVIEAAERGRCTLQDRFPDCLVYAHRPESTKADVMIGCWSVAEDGSVWKGDWPLRPVKDIHEAIYLEQDTESVVRKVRCLLVTPSGRRLRVPLLLRHKTFRFLVEDTPDGLYMLPAGTYRVGLSRSIRSLHEELQDARVVISAISPVGDDVLIPIEKELFPLTLQGRFTGRRDLGVVHADIDTADKDGFMVANWEASVRDIQMLVPPGKISIRVRSSGYRDVTIEQVLEGPRVIEIPLVER